MKKNAKKELLQKALDFMKLRMDLFDSRPPAAEYLGVTEDGLSKWERAERKIPAHAWNQLRRLKEARAAKRSRRTAHALDHPK